MSETIFNLSSLNFAVRNAVQTALPDVQKLVAEISEMRESRGHAYLELIEKDKNGKVIAKARATIWGSVFRMLNPYFKSETGQNLSSGLKVLLTVSVEFHEIYGFSLNIRDIDPSYTLGDIEKKRREIIQQLEEEGIMGMNAELQMPLLPQRIAVISASTAAGYGDFINQLTQNPAGYQFSTTLFDATMQGENTDQSVIEAFERIFASENNFDVVVIIRGGGSRADLSAFDSYIISANICQFPLPIITGIGHERDESIADLAAHTALKTPTAVAEFLISKFADADNKINEMENWLVNKTTEFISETKANLLNVASQLKPTVKEVLFVNQTEINKLFYELQPFSEKYLYTKQNNLEKLTLELKILNETATKQAKNKLKQATERLNTSVKTPFIKQEIQLNDFLLSLKKSLKSFLKDNKHRLELMQHELDANNPYRILEKGYSITTVNGKVITSIKVLSQNTILETHLPDGKIKSKVL